MKKSTGLIFFIFSTVVFVWAEKPADIKDTNAPNAVQKNNPSVSSPTPVSGEFSSKKTPIPYDQKSTVFKKNTIRNKADVNLGLETYFNQANYEGKDKFYNQLNAGLFSSLSSKPKALSPEEQLLGTIGGIAGFGMAAGAAAQALGIIPDGKPKDEKKKK